MEPIKKQLNPDGSRRIIAVSDIHGNLDYFKGLLSKVCFGENDILVIIGDFTEKGPGGLKTLRYLMQLSQKYEVYTLCGNHDIWALLLDGNLESTDESVIDYMAQKPECLAREMCDDIGFEFTPACEYEVVREMLLSEFSEEFDFLRKMPTLLETPHYIFVHGGIPEDRNNAFSYLKYDNFMHCGRKFDKWVIVGHWPVMLYHQNIVNANPVFDYESKIISIDGGCVLKDDGQLNALIIPYEGSEDFSFEAYCDFPSVTALTAQSASNASYYIRWGDNEVKVLERGDEFCRCRHIRTGYEMDILTKYVYGSGEICTVNDCTDYVLPISPGDELLIVETTSRGYFVKHKGISGWYYGKIG
ncbi:MAG: metallophosphoesterase [Oscillospiraceae bacterium]|nr:metallophosphoesterase [Oscillospiraceae bacterium]